MFARQQPQQAPRINRANPITRGLVAAITPVGAGLRDVINGRSPTLVGTAPVPGVTVKGRSTVGSGTILIFTGPEYCQTSSTGYTHFSLTKLTTFSIFQGIWAACSTDVSDAPNSSVGRNFPDDGSIVATQGFYNNIATSNNEAVTLLDGNVHSLCHTGFGGPFHRLDLDGVTVGSITDSGDPQAPSNPCLKLFSERSEGELCAGHYLLHLVWNRSLSIQESRSLHYNPWQVFYLSDAALLAFDAGASSVSAALTGVTGTGSVGTTSVAADKALTGNAGTGATGTIVPAASKALTGNQAAAAVGTVTASTAKGPTGVAATGSAGTLSPVVDKALSGNAATGAAGTVGPQPSLTLTGTAGAGAAGAVTPNVTIPITGASATGAVGTVTASTGVSVALTGVAGTGSAGSVSPSTAQALTGNTATGAVGSIAPATAKALTGNAATSAAGSVSAASSKALTGNAGTGGVGTVSQSVTVALTGASATGAVGSVSAGADATRALTGVSGTGAAGTVSPSITVALAGVSGAGAVGSVTIGQPLTGIAGTGSVGTVSLSASKALTGIEATGALGSVGQNVTVALSGVEAAGEVGTISFVAGDITVALTGVQATGAAGVLAVAGEFSAIAAAVWSYVLSNGKTAGQNVVEIRAMLDLLTPGFWNFAIEGPYTAADLLRVIAAVQAGKSTITALGAGAATVEFRAVDDSEVRVTADMQGSERTEVTLNAN